MNNIKQKRYVALDVLRGMTVAGMIMVNNPGSWTHIFSPLEHSKWVGCTPTDLVFPFFLFIVGAAMAFSFAKYNESLSKASVKKVIKRSIIIFLVGLGLNAFPFFPIHQEASMTFGQNYMYYLHHIRIFGVLQRIAMCYLVGGLFALWLRKPKKIIPAMAILMGLQWLILYLIGDHNAPMANGAAGAFSLAGQGSGAIDISLVGANHVYHGFGVAFDPEGLLGTLSGSCTLLLGFLLGNMIRTTENKMELVAKVYTTGLLCLAAGVVWGSFYPVIKALWTGSYVLYAGGWSTIMLAFFIYLIDIKGKTKAFTPFRAMGMNPLFAFVMSGVLVRLLGGVVKWTSSVTMPDGTIRTKTWSALSWFYQNICVPIIGTDNKVSSLLYAVLFIGLFLLMAMWLYKKKIVIKI
ncbi:MAG: heparan-alpha-glucosaminide N-acetyltransferase domain-containing protein [Bacteroidales bacterium]|nr:heparan-alpha-glucosaminide N-acetyltransferase domain-containing protein [Bacteroidales bacterium]